MFNQMSRRAFLKNSGVALGGLATVRASGASTLLPGSILSRNTRVTATHWGICEAEVVGDRLVAVRPFSRDPGGSSPVIRGFADRVYSPTRVRYPMVRAGFLKHRGKSDTAKRGQDDFVRVSWEQALDLVASELNRVKTHYGSEAIHPGSTDWHSTGKLHSAPTLVRRLLGLHGGYVDNTGDFSVAAAMAILPHVLGGIEVYEQQTAWPTVIKHADTVVLWGCDLLKNNQIGWAPTDHYTYGAVRQLKRKGTRVISVDPRATDAANYLDAQWVAPRPNTDTALMLGLAHTLYSEKLYDPDFVHKYTVGFGKFLPYLLGKSDGRPKSAEWAEQITTVPAATIKKLARTMAQGRTMIMAGWAIQRQDHGEQPYWMLVTLASMLGHIGLPGGGFGMSYHYANGGSLTAKGPSLPGISAGSNPVKTSIPFAHGLSDMLLNPGKSVDFNGTKITYPDIKLIYWSGGNPLSHQMNRNREIEAWRRPETIIVNEPFWSNTARFADIVLPVTTTFERNDIDVVSEYSGHYFVAMPKLIKPLFEAKSDFQIFTELSKRFGFEHRFTEGKTDMEWIRSFWDHAFHQPEDSSERKNKHTSAPSFDEFWERGYIEFHIPPEAKNYVRYEAFRKNPLIHSLGTPSGRIEIYSDTIAKYHYEDCPPHPTWIEPAEWLGSKETKTYPLHIISPHPKFRLHSQMDNTWLRHEYEVKGREPVWIHPSDAKARHINNGDVVRIFNGRGAVLAGAVVTKRVRPGVLMLAEGAWYDPDKPGEPGALCKHGNVNVLTMDKGTSKLAQGNVANTVLVEIEQYSGPTLEVTVFSPPAKRGDK